MKRIFGLLIVVILVLGFSVQAHATLILRGTGTSAYGTYNLIYDDDLDITWYDYTNPLGTWPNQVNWADALTVDFGGTIYTDWRLPTTADGTTVYEYEGSNPDGSYSYTYGYNLYNSEMGHLFYPELGNLGYYVTDGTSGDNMYQSDVHLADVTTYYATDGTTDYHNELLVLQRPFQVSSDTSGDILYKCELHSAADVIDDIFAQPGCGLTNTGDFENLIASVYLSGTEYSANPDNAWHFYFYGGFQGVGSKDGDYYALAVRPGDVAAPIPEPSTWLLLGSGLAGLVLIRKKIIDTHSLKIPK